MKPVSPHGQSQQLRRYKPTRKPAGVFTIGIAFCDSALLVLAFFIAISPFVVQPGINIQLPESPFSDGARFGSMILSVARGGHYYFNDERLSKARLSEVLSKVAQENSGAPLIIEADERVLYGEVVHAWNAALASGISEVSMATKIAVSEDIAE
ncbi:MAG TPA: biopolymer transporter ExbD [Pontiella sp.]